MIELLAFFIAISILICLAATAADRAVAKQLGARRHVWSSALVAAVVIPGILVLTIDTDRSIVAAEAAVRGSAMVESDAPALDTAVKWIWGTASVICFAFLAVAGIGQVRRRSGWPRETVCDREVLVTEATGPAVFGLVRPEIVVPSWLLSLPIEQQRAAVEHELTHKLRKDNLLVFAAAVLIAALPWNLPMWWMMKRLRFAIEVDCDQRVLDVGHALNDYAEVLLSVSQRKTGDALPMALGAASISNLERRIRIMKSERKTSIAAMFGAMLVCVSCVGAGSQLDVPSTDTLTGGASTDYQGERLSLNFQDIPTRRVIQLISDFSGENMVVSDAVDGKTTVRMKDVPWDQALDVILFSQGLEKTEAGGVTYIKPAE